MQFRTRSLFVTIAFASVACAILGIVVRSLPKPNQSSFAIQNYGENSLSEISIKITSSANGRSQVIDIPYIAPYHATSESIVFLGNIEFELEYVLNGRTVQLKNQNIQMRPDATYVVTVFNEHDTTNEGYW